MNLTDELHGISTPTYAYVQVDGQTKSEQGSGFFYNVHSKNKEVEEKGWKEIESVWLVTNRHCVAPEFAGNESLPDSFAFYLRGVRPDSVHWDPIIISKEELVKRTKVHNDSSVDVAAVKVNDLIIEKVKAPGGNYLGWGALSKDKLPGPTTVEVEITDDIIAVGYPRGFYDERHLYPIIKGGYISSPWGVHFEGKPHFLINARLFPGSSGSVILSKPTNFKISADGKALYNKDKQFALLGIYSGDAFREKQEDTHDTGVVWYAQVIEGIIQSGVSFTL